MIKGYLGSYGENLYRIIIDNNCVETIALNEITNPSYMIRQSQYLFVVSEKEDGEVYSFKITEDDHLSFLSKSKTVGSDPCHLCFFKDKLFVANYSSGTVPFFDVVDGIIAKTPYIVKNHNLLSDSDIACFENSQYEKDEERQSEAHAHFVGITPDEKYLCVCDLGLDKVICYDFDGNIISELSLPLGSGPRHLVNVNNDLYIVTELKNTIFHAKYENGKYELVHEYKLLPNDYSDFSNAAAIHLSPCNKFIAASNRGHNSITIFKIEEDGSLSHCATHKTDGDFPRDFTFSDTEPRLICLNQNSDNLSLFTIKNDVINHDITTDCIAKPVMILLD